MDYTTIPTHYFRLFGWQILPEIFSEEQWATSPEQVVGFVRSEQYDTWLTETLKGKGYRDASATVSVLVGHPAVAWCADKPSYFHMVETYSPTREALVAALDVSAVHPDRRYFDRIDETIFEEYGDYE